MKKIVILSILLSITVVRHAFSNERLDTFLQDKLVTSEELISCIEYGIPI